VGDRDIEGVAHCHSSGTVARLSLVAFPFKAEDPAVAISNLEVAARHPRVDSVLAVGAAADDTYRHLAGAAPSIETRTGTPVEVVVQDRIGRRRPGKGDGMNTALRRFRDSAHGRLHFYDADITNFDTSWIDGAEEAADQGFPVVRHYFPRASTDAMITWMVTRPIFALGHRDSILWEIRQPLGGELLLTREAALALVADPLVAERSDWGVDTVLTYATVALGVPIYEHYIADGKQHALYGSLADIRQMLVECFEAAAAVAKLPDPGRPRHEVAPPGPAGPAVAHKVGFDIESTIHLLIAPWSPEAVSAAAELPADLSRPLLANIVRPTFSFMDGARWRRTLKVLLDRYEAAPGWEEVLFRLWVARVLSYATREALFGHAAAMEVLDEEVRRCARPQAPPLR
jgi:mannosylglycerate synthase